MSRRRGDAEPRIKGRSEPIGRSTTERSYHSLAEAVFAFALPTILARMNAGARADLTRGSVRTLVRCVAFVLSFACLTRTAPLRAEPDPCSLRATVSPCFDADPVWLSSGRARFLTLPSPRALDAGALSLLGAAGVSVKPVTLVAPSPHPDGRVVPVLELTSTVTVAARYGFGRGIDAHAALPLVPYQSGTGAEGVTSQGASEVRAFTLRDPRIGLSTAILGAERESPLAVATRLELALPFGDAGALAGAPGPTIAPAAAAELHSGRVALGLDVGFRLRRAVSFGSVREGSELVASAGVPAHAARVPADRLRRRS
jgi:hypothetical protein